MINERVIDQTQRFKNINSCLYFARRLTINQMFHRDGEIGKITAYCKPVRKNDKLEKIGSQIATQSRNKVSVCDCKNTFVFVVFL